VTVAGGNGPGTAADQFACPFDVVVDSNGDLHVSDPGNHRVQRWAPGGTSGVTVAGGYGQGTAAWQFKSAGRVALHSSRDLYIADGGNHRVQRWALGPPGN
jgi:hypothetical protein